MDHAHYAYSPIVSRPPLAWPGGAPLAVVVYLHLEYFSMETGPAIVRDPRYNTRSAPDVLHHSWFEYGNRIGIFRLLEALQALNMRVTVPANAVAAERNPRLVRHLTDLGVEFLGHGLTATQMQSSRMSEEEEASFIATAARRLEAATGQRPTGWLSQDHGNSTRTPRLLAEAGFSYCADWTNDDQPYWMAYPGLISVPNHKPFDDLFAIWDRHLPPSRYADIVGEGARYLAGEGAASGRFLSLSLRPWVAGASHRIKHIERALGEIARVPDVWFATAGEVARHFAATTPQPVPA
jgi:hypothetical protein